MDAMKAFRSSSVNLGVLTFWLALEVRSDFHVGIPTNNGTLP